MLNSSVQLINNSLAKYRLLGGEGAMCTTVIGPCSFECDLRQGWGIELSCQCQTNPRATMTYFQPQPRHYTHTRAVPSQLWIS